MQANTIHIKEKIITKKPSKQKTHTKQNQIGSSYQSPGRGYRRGVGEMLVNEHRDTGREEEKYPVS